jgi:hypothetical protein
MDTRRLPLNEHQSFIRFDPGCMTATTTDGIKALGVLAKENWPNQIESVCWKVGTVVVIDNWRMLHGRGRADCPDSDRKLMRISIR